MPATTDNLYWDILDVRGRPVLFANSSADRLVAAIAIGCFGCRQACIGIVVKRCADMLVILFRGAREQASISSWKDGKQRRRSIDRLIRVIKIAAGEGGPRTGVAPVMNDIEPRVTKGHLHWAMVGRAVIRSGVLRSLRAPRCNSAYLPEKTTLDQFDTRAARSHSTLPRWARSEGKRSAKASLDDKSGRQ